MRPLSNDEKITSAFGFSIECFCHKFSTHYKGYPIRKAVRFKKSSYLKNAEVIFSSSLPFLPFCFLLIIGGFTACKNSSDLPIITTKKWAKTTLSFESQPTSETAEDNPFLNHRLSVKFIHPQKTVTISGCQVFRGGIKSEIINFKLFIINLSRFLDRFMVYDL